MLLLLKTETIISKRKLNRNEEKIIETLFNSSAWNWKHITDTDKGEHIVRKKQSRQPGHDNRLYPIKIWIRELGLSLFDRPRWRESCCIVHLTWEVYLPGSCSQDARKRSQAAIKLRTRDCFFFKKNNWPHEIQDVPPLISIKLSVTKFYVLAIWKKTYTKVHMNHPDHLYQILHEQLSWHLDQESRDDWN